MVAAAERAGADGIRSMVGSPDRRVPAIALARQLVQEGRVGEVRHVRAQYLQDWLVDPAPPLTWRSTEGPGRKWCPGGRRRPCHRPHPLRHGERLDRCQCHDRDLRASSGRCPAPCAGCPRRSASAAARSPSTTRRSSSPGSPGSPRDLRGDPLRHGPKNSIRLEVNGTRGSLAFDFDDMNVLQVHDATVPSREAGFTRVIVTEPSHPYVEHWWPAGHGPATSSGFTRPGGRPDRWDRPWRRPRAVLRRRPGRAGGARRRRAQRRGPVLLDTVDAVATNGATG